ncbi:ABC transporter permease, partial [Staphylococcus arlettae]
MTSSFSEILQEMITMPNVQWSQVWVATYETLYMTVIATIFAFIFG